jgi:hypothetical protein
VTPPQTSVSPQTPASPQTSILEVVVDSVLMGADAIPGPAALPCAIVIAAMAGLLVWVLERKLKPVEVVS